MLKNLEPNFDFDLTHLLESIYQKYRYDFRGYSRISIKRQVNQAINKFDCENVKDLEKKIIHEPNIFGELFQLHTVGLSTMFRDPSYFRAIRTKVIPILKTFPSIKIWIAGCSTGEEVYSFAIPLKEEGLLKQTIIYATDINSKSLEKAESGIFKLEDVQSFTRNYQNSGGKGEFSDHYTAAFDAAIFHKSLVQNVIFADHCLSTDQVFTETQLISCRNVFIYFGRKLQDRAIGLFYNSLCDNGVLGLGTNETAEFSQHADAFKQLILSEKIYQKNAKISLQEGKS